MDAHLSDARACPIGQSLKPQASQQDEFQRRRALLCFTLDDERHLKRIHDRVDDVVAPFIDAFYDHLQSFGALQPFLSDPVLVGRLKAAQQTYFRELTGGPHDEAYDASRMAMGMTHARVGLEPAWFFGAYSHYLAGLMPTLFERLGPEPQDVVPAIQALIKVVLLDMGLSIDAYIARRDERISRLQDYRNALAGMPFGTVLLDKQLHVIFVNQALRELFQLGDTPVDGRAMSELVNLGALQPLMQDAQAGKPLRVSITIGQPSLSDAHPIPIAITLSTLPELNQAEGERLLLIIEDLRVQAKLEADLSRAQEAAGVGTWFIDLRTMTVQWSEEACRLYDHPIGESATYAQLLSKIHPLDREMYQAAVQAGLAGEDYHVEFRIVRQSGEIRWIESRGQLQCDAAGEPMSALGTVQDVTERKQASERIRRLAFYDALTGLPNRTLAMDRLSHAILQADRAQQQVALLYVDLDHFKEINDTQGHGVGDQVLTEVAARMSSVVRQRDTLARLGGDEFVLLGQMDATAAAQVAGRLMETLRAPVDVNGMRFNVGMSTGIALYPDDGQTVEDLLKHADTAMYRAKAGGGDSVCFYHAGMSDALNRRLSLSNRLKVAMCQEALRLHYQPKINLKTGQLNGAEALARWYDQEEGCIQPSEFIPLAETRGLISELGDWVLSHAAKQLKAWRDAGTPMKGRLAVNVSQRQLAQPDFVRHAVRLVEEMGASPQEIELEITESAMMEDPQLAQAQACGLVEAGFALSIDDFGTGYSSLARLKRLPVSKLKIDMGFVRDMLSNAEDLTIVQTIVSMARALGLETVAEGVEKMEQQAALRAMGCDEVQGFLHDKALPAEAFVDRWLTQFER